MGWTLSLFGRVGLYRDGNPVRLRTQHQLLLLTRLVSHHPNSVNRSETAALLWPDALPPNRSTYLRRALMELRQAGVPIVAIDHDLALDWSQFSSDYQSTNVSGEPLEDILHPIAEEARVRWRNKRRAEVDYTSADSPGVRLKLFIIDRLIEENPDQVLATLVAHGSEMVYGKPIAGLLDLYMQILDAAKDSSPQKVKALLYASILADIQTRYALSRRLLYQCIPLAESLGMAPEVAQAYGSLANHYAQFHNFEVATRYAHAAIDKALEMNNPRSASGAMINLGHIYGQQLRFEEAVEQFVHAFNLAQSIDFDGQMQVAIASLAFYWGVLGCAVPREILSRAKRHSELGYMGVIDAYTHFALAVGQGDAQQALDEAKVQLKLTAEEGMERLFYVALDCAAIGLSMNGKALEASIVVRASTRFRRNLHAGRTPVERLVIRRHVAPPYFSPDIREGFLSLNLEEPSQLAESIRDLMP